MKIIAHRGNDGFHKENTEKAILNSLKFPYVDGVEFDVRMTKDYKFVIYHEPFYEGKLISITRCKKLKGLSTLEEVLSKINSNKIIMIEIKEIGDNKLLLYYLYKVLKKYNLNYYICSFNYKIMKLFLKKHPKIKCGLIIGMKLNIDFIQNDFDFNVINYKAVDMVTSKETFIWTVNNNKELELIPDDCHIITDRVKNMYCLIKHD